jgi:hypothetical protein
MTDPAFYPDNPLPYWDPEIFLYDAQQKFHGFFVEKTISTGILSLLFTALNVVSRNLPLKGINNISRMFQFSAVEQLYRLAIT